jgi:hypothetical protein
MAFSDSSDCLSIVAAPACQGGASMWMKMASQQPLRGSG